MKSKNLTQRLLISCVFFVAADIVLLLRFVLPLHETQNLNADETVSFDTAAAECGCLHKTFPNGTNKLFDLRPPVKNKHPFLLSMHINVTVGGQKRDSEFICAAVICGDNVIHTAKSCIYKPSYTFITGGSVYWHNTRHLKFLKERWSSLGGAARIITTPKNHGLDVEDYSVCLNASFNYAYVVGWEDAMTIAPFREQKWTTVGVALDYLDIYCAGYAKKTTFLKVAVTVCKEVLVFTGFNEQEFCMKYKAVKYNKEIPEEEFKKCK